MIRNSIAGLLIIIALGNTGCKKVLDIDSSRAVGEKNMWNKLEDTRGALMGIYGLTRSAMADNNSFWIYGDVRSGDFVSPVRQDLRAVIGNQLNASYPVLDGMSNWRRWYAVINSANIFLERVGDVKAADPRYTENNMTVDIAQARFLRAFAYFYMVRIWGDVPFIISSHDGQFENKRREDQSRVLAWAEQEILAAAADLPYKYSANDIQQPGNYYNENETRWAGALARKLSAYAVLAHIAAWQGNYPDVATYTKFVLDNYGKGAQGYLSTDDLARPGGFFYEKKYNHMLGFNFDYGHADGYFTGHIEELTLAAPIVNKSVPDIYMTKDSILSIFNEVKDERFSLDTLGRPSTERYFANFNGKYPIFSKIKVITSGSTDPTFRFFSSAIVFTRLEDITLLRAEALAVLGEKQGAIDNLNIIRELRKLDRYDETINGNLVDQIFRERRRELMGEGHRWYDMIRYQRIRQLNPQFLQLINNGGIYWPIAQDNLNQNGLLTQNSYWK
ncbi:RagB/SusD family nutrient uptake outer membrane protein [Pedobacter sp. BAL39]|uniref:RagB/SusD family nutrient uptake outer membrane protein n=1 Tax=Pedobacter sp. BAL39 TaxID=391596 RepID=UPI00058685EE|nr:RagB/SusD family nutrient uptake outer membrane protein [Pedobacter sp. BAL39]